ncbi:MAG: hypothetical protein LUD03_05800 [Firmicutes bacterium]|nr:hypothetical protein [Bacillota bacterium]
MSEKNTKRGKAKQIILSLILAIIVWAGVIYVNPPEISTTVYNLPIRFSGEDHLKDKSLTVVDRSEIEGLSVVISGRRNDLLNLSGDIYVEVDVSSVNAAGTYNLSGNVTLPSAKLTIVNVNFESVPITVDNITEKEINIEINQTGTSDYLVKTTAAVDKVTLIGAESELEEVSYGLITADISDVEKDMTFESSYILMNKSGSPITKNETIESSVTKVDVDYEIYESVSLPVAVKLSDELADDYKLDAKSTVSPSRVDVGIRLGYDSPKSVYAVVEKIDDTVTCNLEETDGIYIPDGQKTVTVKLSAQKILSDDINVSVSLKNLDDAFSAQADDITVTATGTESELDADNITAYADLSGYTEAGEYEVPVTVESDTLAISGEYTASVTINER